MKGIKAHKARKRRDHERRQGRRWSDSSRARASQGGRSSQHRSVSKTVYGMR